MRVEVRYGFRRVRVDDLDMLSDWFEAPHVARWWDNTNGKGVAGVRRAMESTACTPMIVEFDGRPIGYVQTYAPHLEDGHPYRDQPAGTLGFDQFIGISELTGQGHGPRMIDALAQRRFAEGAPRIVVDPDPANRRAIRAYEKAGFAAFDRRTTPYGPALMMKRDAP